MSVDFKEFNRKMDKTLEVLQENFGAIRAGRANARVLDRITVEYYGEEGKVAVRNIRRDAMDYIKKLKKDSEITEDDQKKAEKDLQELTDKYIKKVDDACAVKEKELMEI